MSKQQVIVNLLRAEFHRASEAYRHAHAEHMGTVAAANAWDDSNPDDGVGGMSANPYNINAASDKEQRCRLYSDQMREAYEFAVDTFIAKAESA